MIKKSFLVGEKFAFLFTINNNIAVVTDKVVGCVGLIVMSGGDNNDNKR